MDQCEKKNTCSVKTFQPQLGGGAVSIPRLQLVTRFVAVSETVGFSTPLSRTEFSMSGLQVGAVISRDTLIASASVTALCVCVNRLGRARRHPLVGQWWLSFAPPSLLSQRRVPRLNSPLLAASRGEGERAEVIKVCLPLRQIVDGQLLVLVRKAALQLSGHRLAMARWR